MLLKKGVLTVLEQGELVVGPAVGPRRRGTRPPSTACGTRGISLHQRYMSCLTIKTFFLF